MGKSGTSYLVEKMIVLRTVYNILQETLSEIQNKMSKNNGDLVYSLHSTSVTLKLDNIE